MSPILPEDRGFGSEKIIINLCVSEREQCEDGVGTGVSVTLYTLSVDHNG